MTRPHQTAHIGRTETGTAPEREWTQDEIDEEAFDDEEEDDGSECGRWNNGHLTSQCRKAGSEECDWDCPIGLPHPAGPRVLP